MLFAMTAIGGLGGAVLAYGGMNTVTFYPSQGYCGYAGTQGTGDLPRTGLSPT